MKRASLPGMGWLGVTLGLFVACSGKVQSLGETAGVGGKGARNLGGAAGAESTNPTGGSAYEMGGRGGAPPIGAAGTDNASGGLYMGAAGFRTHDDLGGPIDPSCKCANATQSCDVSQQCVPRCTPEGLCVKWLSKHAVKSMYHDGTALYFAEARSTDVLGNPVEPADGALYTLSTATGSAPVLIAAELQDPLKILGRYGGSTFLLTSTGTTYAIYEITDAGVVTKLTDAYSPVASMQGKWLLSTAVDAQQEQQLLQFDLESSRTPTSNRIGGLTAALVVGDRAVVRQNLDPISCQSFSLPTPTAASTSLTALTDTTSELLAADSSRIFFGGGTHPYVRAYDTSGNPQLVLYNDSTMNRIGATLLANGWLYSNTYQDSYWKPLQRVVRFPTTVGRLPQQVLPADLGTALFAVGKGDFYWSYPQANANAAHYIFHAPLPAQPCDAELPCADTTEVCTNGLCSAP